MTATAPETTRGHGFYSLNELCRYVAVMSGDRKDVDRVPGWLEYPLNTVEHTRWQPDYSFGDLISLFVVSYLLRKGVKPRRIRTAENHLRDALRTDRPFLHADLQTDGIHVYWRDNVVDGQTEVADEGGQQAMRELVAERLERVLYTNDWAACWYPIKHVVLDPRIQFGEPTVAGTRLLTGIVADAARRLGSSFLD